MNSRGSAGFTLIEISVVLTVIGLFLTAFASVYHAEIAKERKQKTEDAVFIVADALGKYITDASHLNYPCVARMDVGPGDPLYGVAGNCADTASVAPGSCGNGYCVAERLVDDDGDGTPEANVRIRIGSIPFRDLDIAAQDQLDGYGNRFLYAVTERQAVAATYEENNGAIEVIEQIFVPADPDAGTSDQTVVVTHPGVDEDGDPLLPVDMVFLSHGADGVGAVLESGNPSPMACPASGATLDQENCDMDGTFMQGLFAQGGGAAHFDDMIVWNLFSWIYVWDDMSMSDNSNQDIYSRNYDNIGIGVTEPTQKLHVGNGNILVEATDKVFDAGGNVTSATGGKVVVSNICEDLEPPDDNCFAPEALGGDPSQNGGMVCDSSEVLLDIRNGEPVCGSIFGPVNGGCNVNETLPQDFVTGFYMTGAPNRDISVRCRNIYGGGTYTADVE